MANEDNKAIGTKKTILTNNSPTSPLDYPNKTGLSGDVKKLSFNIIDDISNPTLLLAPSIYIQYNPSTLNFQYQKKITRRNTFAAIVEEHWGDELDILTADGSTGAFVHPNEEIGLTVYYRKFTDSYKNHTEIVNIYRNNGNFYNNQGIVIKKGYVLLTYDMGTYIGFFENFNVTETAEKPFRFTYTFNFKAEKSFNKV